MREKWSFDFNCACHISNDLWRIGWRTLKPTSCGAAGRDCLYHPDTDSPTTLPIRTGDYSCRATTTAVTGGRVEWWWEGREGGREGLLTATMCLYFVSLEHRRTIWDYGNIRWYRRPGQQLWLRAAHLSSPTCVAGRYSHGWEVNPRPVSWFVWRFTCNSTRLRTVGSPSTRISHFPTSL